MTLRQITLSNDHFAYHTMSHDAMSHDNMSTGTRLMTITLVA